MKVGDLVKFKRPTNNWTGKVHLVLSIEPIDGLRVRQVKLAHIDNNHDTRTDYGWYHDSDLEVAQSHN